MTGVGGVTGHLAGRSRRPGHVAVIGAGYVGLTTAICLAHSGSTVVCADNDPDKVERLGDGIPTIVEQGLGEMLQAELAPGRLRFVLGGADAVNGAEFVFICVPTPPGPDGSADLSVLATVAVEIGPLLERGAIVVNKSTVPVGSTTFVEQLLGRSDVAVVSNPEFLREGSAVHDTLHPDRIVVGADDPRAAARVGELFAPTHAPLIVTDAATAETIKYASNAFIATKLSFVNQIANLCESVGADVRDVLLGMGYDHRIGFDYMRPGPGWGGSCLPKDTRALLRLSEDAGYRFGLLEEVIAANERQLESVAEKVVDAAGGGLDGKVVASWGLTFKAGTDDRRESPAIDVLGLLLQRGAAVQAYDPTVRAVLPELPEVVVCADPYAACAGAHVLVVLTEWEELRWLELAKVKTAMAAPAIVDARNLLDPAAARRLGFSYQGIGRA